MTVRLSPHKVRKILNNFFYGITQTEIATKARVDQSCVSHYASRFKKTAAEYGVLAAAKEYQVLNEVETLRSLSVELYKSKLTVEEAKQGYDIIKAFLKLGISPEQHLNLIAVCKEVEDPNFVTAALKLARIESQSGMRYHQVISDFKEATGQLPQLKNATTLAKTKLKAINDALHHRKQELADQEKYLEKYRNEVKAKVAQMEKSLSLQMKRLGVEKKEVEEVAALKTELTKKGLNLRTVLKLVKEFRGGSDGN
ncbi:hypothetical protein ACFLU4_05280 [Chloroflexota bacterium]